MAGGVAGPGGLAMKMKRNDHDDGFEIFEYEPRWHKEFSSTRIVDEWCSKCPKQFSREPICVSPPSG